MTTKTTTGIMTVSQNGFSTRIECNTCHAAFSGNGHLSAAADHAVAAHADHTTRLADLLDAARSVMFRG